MKKSKNKLFYVTFLSLCVAIIALLTSVIVALASKMTTYTINMTITYTAVDIAGNVTADYTVGGTTTAMVTSSGAQKLTLSGNEEDPFSTTLSPQSSIYLSKESDSVVFRYSFTNIGTTKYWAVVTYEDTLDTDKNYIMTYSKDGSTYTSVNNLIEVNGVEDGQEETDPVYYYIKVQIDNLAYDTVFSGNFNWLLSTIDPYLLSAKNAISSVKLNNSGSIEENTYVYVTKVDSDIAWFKYASGQVVAIDTEPSLTLDYAYPMTKTNTDYLTNDVVVYRPMVTKIVNKLNALLSGENIESYEDICQAGNNLTDLEIDIINWGRISINSDTQTIKYSFAYDRFNNKTYILNSDATEISYTSSGLTSVPTNYRYLTGANIDDENDLLNFSKITNKWTANSDGISNLLARPNEENFYMAHKASEFEHAPLVIMNINSNIDMSLIETLEDWEPIANWYNFANSNDESPTGYSNCYDISLLVNGNNHKFSNLSVDVLFGALKSDSILQDFEIGYTMGTETNFYDITQNGNTVIKSKLNSTYSGGYWNFAITIRGIRNVQCPTFDYKVATQIKNVKLTGKCYVSIVTKAKTDTDNIGIIANICSEKYAPGEGTAHYSNAEKTVVNFQDCSIFAGENDAYYKDSLTASRILHYQHEADINDVCLSVDGTQIDGNSSITFTN